MPFSKEHVKLSWIFGITGTTEIAETSLNITTPTGSPYDAEAAAALMTSADADTLSGDLFGMMNSSDFLWGDYSSYVALKVAAINTAGHYLADAVVYPRTGHAGTHNNVPPQDSLVLSLRSGSSFGEANFGRMYIPHTIAALDTSSARMSVAKAVAIANAFQAFITQVNTMMDSQVAGSGVAIMSQKGSGTTKLPTLIGCGRVIDTQRRRRNRLDEDTQLVVL
jgi:hypothetical protein